jgi:hypothetical protein
MPKLRWLLGTLCLLVWGAVIMDSLNTSVWAKAAMSGLLFAGIAGITSTSNNSPWPTADRG